MNQERLALRFTAIINQLCSWHRNKNIMNKICSFFTQAAGKCLRQWASAISTHVYHCLDSCNGNVKLLMEKLKAIPLHMQNIHKFPANEYFKGCSPMCLLYMFHKKPFFPSNFVLEFFLQFSYLYFSILTAPMVRVA